MKVLLAGAFGNLGSEILRALVRGNHEVIAADMGERDLGEEVAGKYRFVPINVTDPATLKGICDGVDTVITTVGLTKTSATLNNYQIDYQGNRTGVSYFNAALQPVSVPDGYHHAEYRWDADGHLLSETYYDAEGKLTNHIKGYASFVRRYDVRGNLVHEVYYGADGNITRVTAGTGSCMGMGKSASWRVKAERKESIFFSTGSRSTLPTREMRELEGW